ncbi:MAG: glycosyltransferase family 4 protein [Saprospiraceae bacterium]|nr:glycosyltransferase family 4 protein [Saprospiraceae bacterium]
MSKKILYLTYFFEPDLGAGAFRNTSLAKELSNLIQPDDEIELITTYPNRYSNLDFEVGKDNVNSNLLIHRIKVLEHGNSFLGQIRSFLSYRKGVRKLTKDKNYDLVFASSSKLFTAYLAYTIAKSKKTALYVDLRDLFSENLKELIPKFRMGHFFSFVVKNLFEKPALKYASHLNLNSEGFKEEFQYRSSGHISFYPNGIDDYFIGHKQNNLLQKTPIIITYAGNIGEGQGLEKIIPELSQRLGNKYLFSIIGSGSSLHKFEAELKRFPRSNVKIIAPIPRKDLLDYYKNSHYLFLHLNNYKSFEKVIPSKVFEYGAFNMPIIAGVAGYPATFIREEIKDNCFIFDPCNVDAVHHYLLSNIYYLQDRKEFINKYKRDSISKKLAQSILQYL